MHDDVKTTAIIAATIWDGEPRYVLAALDRGFSIILRSDTVMKS